MKKDKLILSLFLGSIFFNQAIWLFWLFKIGKLGYFPFSFLGSYFLPSFTLLVIILNTLLSSFIYQKDKLLSYLFLGIALFLQILTLILGIMVY